MTALINCMVVKCDFLEECEAGGAMPDGKESAYGTAIVINNSVFRHRAARLARDMDRQIILAKMACE